MFVRQNQHAAIHLQFVSKMEYSIRFAVDFLPDVLLFVLCRVCGLVMVVILFLHETVSFYCPSDPGSWNLML